MLSHQQQEYMTVCVYVCEGGREVERFGSNNKNDTTKGNADKSRVYIIRKHIHIKSMKTWKRMKETEYGHEPRTSHQNAHNKSDAHRRS